MPVKLVFVAEKYYLPIGYKVLSLLIDRKIIIVGTQKPIVIKYYLRNRFRIIHLSINQMVGMGKTACIIAKVVLIKSGD